MSLAALTKKSSGDSPPDSARPRRKRSLAWLLPVGLLVGFLLILALLFGERLTPAVAVTTAPVVTIRTGDPAASSGEVPAASNPEDEGKGGLLFQASGWVEPDPYPIFVPTLVEGTVDKVHALEGQRVKEGELLATLIDEDAELDLREARRKYLSLEKKIEAHWTGFDVLKAQMTAARRKVDALQAQLNEAEDTDARLAELSPGAVSRQQKVQARLAVERQKAMLAEAEAEIPRLEAQVAQLTAERESMLANLDELETARDRAQLALDRTRITSPVDGTVLHLHVAPGSRRMLRGESPKSAVVVELYDPDKLQARIDVPLNEAAALRPGLPVELVSELLPDTTFIGTVTRVTGQADLQRNTLQAKVEIDNPDERLRPDMLVRAKFFAPPAGSPGGLSAPSSGGRFSLFVPEAALVSESQVWVVSPDSTAEKRTIELGDEVRDQHRLVVEGLRSGESVILPPHDQLEEGIRVEPSTPETPKS